MREKTKTPAGRRRGRVQYVVVSKRYYSRELGVYRSCDIVACDVCEHSIVARVRDVTINPELALSIVEILNRCQLAPIHLEEVIDDILQ